MKEAERVKLVQKLAASGAMLLGSILFAVRPASAQTVTAVPKLDMERFVGAWHEMARLPNKAEKLCLSNAVALYATGDKARRFTLVTSCQTAKGPSDGINRDGKMDKSGDGRLTVTSIWPFSKKRWVIALGPEYEWALLGSPNHKSLWILSRSPALKPEVLQEIEAKAASEGFDTAKLLRSPQNP